MPKSKRNKIVHLTQVKKKGKDHKEDLMKQLEQYVAQYQLVYLFDFDETKCDRIMNLRLRLKELGRIFAGRNSLVSVTLRAIGRRTRTNYASLVGQITGHRGLFFTNLECNKLVQKLEAEQPEFRAKLLGYAQLKATDDDTGGSDGGNDDDDDVEDENVDDETNNTAGAKGSGAGAAAAAAKAKVGPRKRVTFRPIEQAKGAQKAPATDVPVKGSARKKAKKAKGKGAKGTPMET